MIGYNAYAIYMQLSFMSHVLMKQIKKIHAQNAEKKFLCVKSNNQLHLLK